MSAIFEVAHLCLSFGGLTVADDISFSMRAGERVALIGPNGAGKTTLVNLATGDLRPDSGKVLLSGEDITKLDVAGRVRRGLVRSFQVSRLIPDMTPAEHVGLAILQRLGRTGSLFGDFRSMPDVAAEASDLLARLGLAELAWRKAGEIAYGQQRLLEIAISLALKPRVLLLDEPAAGVPHGDLTLVEAALAALPQDLAVLMIEHDMDLVFRFATRLVVMAAGCIIFDGPPVEAAANPQVREAYLGSYAHASRIS